MALTAMTKGTVSKTITASSNAYSDSIKIFGNFNFSVIDSGVGNTVILQRSDDGGTVWKTVKSYTASEEDTGNEPERGTLYRAGIAAASYSTGTVIIRIGF